MPTVETTGLINHLGENDHEVNLPSGIEAGDILIAVMATDMTNGDGGFTWAGGWFGLASRKDIATAWKLADGTEGATETIVHTETLTRSVIGVYRVSGAADVNKQQPECSSTPMPDGYRGLSSTESYGTFVATAEKNVEAASEDPSAFAMVGSDTWAAATVAVHPKQSSYFPVVSSRMSTRDFSGVTTSTINYPPGMLAGEVIIAFYNKAAGGDDHVWPSDWTVILNKASPSNSRMTVGWHKVDTTEGATFDVTTTASDRSSTVVLRISGAANPDVQPPEASAGASGTSATPDPDEVTPTGGIKRYLMIAAMGGSWGSGYLSDAGLPEGTDANPDPPNITPTGGSKDYLFIAATNYAQNADADTAPSGYSNLITESEYECGMGMASLEATGSAEDPGTFLWTGAADTWEALTIAVHPYVGTIPGIAIIKPPFDGRPLQREDVLDEFQGMWAPDRLKFCATLQERDGLVVRDIISGDFGTSVDNSLGDITKWYWTPDSSVKVVVAWPTRVFLWPVFNGVTGYPFTELLVCQTFDGAINGALLDLGSSTSNTTNYTINASGHFPQIWCRNGGAIRSVIATTDISDRLHAVIVVHRSSTYREIYVDGISEGTNTDSVPFTTTPDRVALFQLYDSTPSNRGEGTVSLAAIWDDGLSPVEIERTSNLFGLITRKRRTPPFKQAAKPHFTVLKPVRR